MVRGWYRDSYRHSLASKGIRTSFVANSRKGWRSKPQDLVWSDRHQRFVDWRKVAAAEGIKTGNKRRATVGDTMEIPIGVDIYEGQVGEQPSFTAFEAEPRQVTLPVTPPIVQQFEAPPRMTEEPVPLPTYESEQQAQPVEEELPMGALSPPFISKKKKEETLSALALPDPVSVEQTVPLVPKIMMAAKKRRYE